MIAATQCTPAGMAPVVAVGRITWVLVDRMVRAGVVARAVPAVRVA